MGSSVERNASSKYLNRNASGIAKKRKAKLADGSKNRAGFGAVDAKEYGKVAALIEARNLDAKMLGVIVDALDAVQIANLYADDFDASRLYIVKRGGDETYATWCKTTAIAFADEDGADVYFLGTKIEN